MRVSYRHLAFTGNKKEITGKQQAALKALLRDYREAGFLWMHNGDCIGSDYKAAVLWQSIKGKVQLHPPSKDSYRAFFPSADIVTRPRPYLERDHDMVDQSEVLIATPITFDEQTRSGTWATVRYARRLHLVIVIIFPDGSIRRE